MSGKKCQKFGNKTLQKKNITWGDICSMVAKRRLVYLLQFQLFFFFLCVKLIPVSAQIKRKNKRIFFLIFEEFDADTKRRSTKHTDLFTEKTNSFLVKQLLWTKKKAQAEKSFFLAKKTMRFSKEKKMSLASLCFSE